MSCGAIYLIKRDLELESVSFDSVGWEVNHREVGSPCQICGRPHWERSLPGVFEAHEDGVLADFYFGQNFVARAEVAEQLANAMNCLRAEDAKVFIDYRRKRPYEGPAVKELIFTHRIPWNPKLPSLDIQLCPGCGRANRVKLHDVESGPYEDLIAERWEMMPSKPRVPGRGIIVLKKDVGDCDFFVYGDTRFELCTARARAYIEGKGWSGLQFLEYGEIVPD